MTRVEFERRYTLHPEIKKAELIEGAVYVASPVYLPHGRWHLSIAGLVFNYIATTPAIRAADNVSIYLDSDNEVQPDVCMWLDEQAGGRVRAAEGSALAGAPEFVVEVAVTTAAYDLHDKLHVYRRNQVQEYLVLAVHEQETFWHVWQDGRYVRLHPDSEGVFCSRVFPGFWFHSRAFWAGDMATVLATLQEGMRSAEYLKLC